MLNYTLLHTKCCPYRQLMTTNVRPWKIFNTEVNVEYYDYYALLVSPSQPWNMKDVFPGICFYGNRKLARFTIASVIIRPYTKHELSS